jgi:hypothetical protein
MRYDEAMADDPDEPATQPLGRQVWFATQIAGPDALQGKCPATASPDRAADHHQVAPQPVRLVVIDLKIDEFSSTQAR